MEETTFIACSQTRSVLTGVALVARAMCHNKVVAEVGWVARPWDEVIDVRRAANRLFTVEAIAMLEFCQEFANRSEL